MVVRPVRGLEVPEDDPGVAEAVGRVAPDVEVSKRAAGCGTPGALEPRVLIRGVGQDQLGDHPEAAAVRLAQERPKVAQRSVGRMDLAVVGDVVAVVAQRRRIEGQEPQGGDAELLQVVELLDEPTEVADAVAVAVVEGPHVQLVDDGVLVPVGRSVLYRRNGSRDVPEGWPGPSSWRSPSPFRPPRPPSIPSARRRRRSAPDGNVGRHGRGVEPHEVPGPSQGSGRRSGGRGHDRKVGVEAERREVEVDPAGLGVGGVEIDHHQDRSVLPGTRPGPDVVAHLADGLRVGDELVVVDGRKRRVSLRCRAGCSRRTG